MAKRMALRSVGFSSFFCLFLLLDLRGFFFCAALVEVGAGVAAALLVRVVVFPAALLVVVSGLAGAAARLLLAFLGGELAGWGVEGWGARDALDEAARAMARLLQRFSRSKSFPTLPASF